jgi:hypothetical protein
VVNIQIQHFAPGGAVVDATAAIPEAMGDLPEIGGCGSNHAFVGEGLQYSILNCSVSSGTRLNCGASISFYRRMQHHRPDAAAGWWP